MEQRYDVGTWATRYLLKHHLAILESFQNFAKKAKIGSSGFLLHVMKGERNLSRPVLLKVCAAIGFNKKETEYFEDLVSFNQAKTQTEKDFYFGKIMGLRQSVQVKNLDDEQYEFFANWYYSVIRELAPMLPTGMTASAMAKYVIPGITSAQIKRSLQLLLKLGILKKNENGAYAQTDSFIKGISTPTRKMGITKFQQSMLVLAKQAWDHFPENDISMVTSTLTLSEEVAQQVKSEIKAFNQHLLNLAQADTKPATRVYHINLNLFPVTKKIKEPVL